MPERNLILALQVLELTQRVVLCVNLMDEARRHGIQVDLEMLSQRLGGAGGGASLRRAAGGAGRPARCGVPGGGRRADTRTAWPRRAGAEERPL